jgi:hypothetical protein
MHGETIKIISAVDKVYGQRKSTTCLVVTLPMCNVSVIPIK